MGSHSPIIQHKSQQIVHAELPLITEDNFYLLVRHITNHVKKISRESSYPTPVLVIGSWITCYEAHEFTYHKNADISHKFSI